MKEHPILFSGPMVRAILAGQKTQTRRIIAPQPYFRDRINLSAPGWCWESPAHLGPKLGGWPDPGEFGRELAGHCPYGQPNDRLWVRETWQTYTTPEDRDLSQIVYAADHDSRRPMGVEDEWSWRPSIFLPRWACRLTLEITEVRVQRLQEITNDEAFQEGIREAEGPDGFPLKAQRMALALHAFAHLWDSINAKRAPWESNPWVWALTFRVSA